MQRVFGSGRRDRLEGVQGPAPLREPDVAPRGHQARRERWETAAPITIGDNVWFGGGVIVCPGVTVGRNSVIGSGSVVTRDVPDHVIAVGNPCRVLRELPREPGA